MKTKYWIVVKNRRAYLHSEWDIYSLKCKGNTIYPLGNNAELINKIKEKYNCEVQFV